MKYASTVVPHRARQRQPASDRDKNRTRRNPAQCQPTPPNDAKSHPPYKSQYKSDKAPETAPTRRAVSFASGATRTTQKPPSSVPRQNTKKPPKSRQLTFWTIRPVRYTSTRKRIIITDWNVSSPSVDFCAISPCLSNEARCSYTFVGKLWTIVPTVPREIPP